MSVDPISAKVLVWYPTESQARPGYVNRGHAAIYLGDMEVGKRFELSIDPDSPFFRPANAVEKNDPRVCDNQPSRRSPPSVVQRSHTSLLALPLSLPQSKAYPDADAELVSYGPEDRWENTALTTPCADHAGYDESESGASDDASTRGLLDWDMMEDAASLRADSVRLPGVMPNDNYVSWWPLLETQNDSVPVKAGAVACPALGPHFDEAQEESKPHVTFDLHGLDVTKMRETWHAVRDDPKRGYTLLNRNCSDIGMRILTAGGAFEKLSLARSVWNGSRLVRAGFATRPVHVAQLCEALCAAGYATRHENPSCPPPSARPNLLRQLVGY